MDWTRRYAQLYLEMDTHESFNEIQPGKPGQALTCKK